ncbi:MAG: hypothetical protein ACI9SF_000829 [Candidatus Nanohaloarchaea archaeon]|jgi:hypothetical protein
MDLEDPDSFVPTLEEDLEHGSSKREDYLYDLIDSKLDKLYTAARKQSTDEVDAHQEELRQLYQSVDPIEPDRII